MKATPGTPVMNDPPPSPATGGAPAPPPPAPRPKPDPDLLAWLEELL